MPYKRTKLAAERIALEAGAIVVNPTTPVGEGDRKPTPTGRMIAGVARGRIRGFVATTGLNVVDVRDVARGHALALERGRPRERYLLGGVNLPLEELFAALADLAGRGRPNIRSLCFRLGRGQGRIRQRGRGAAGTLAHVLLVPEGGRSARLRAGAGRAGARPRRGRGRKDERTSMKFRRSTVQIGRYVASQRGERYLLVIMLEPTLGCNIACIGCGKIREYESNKARLTVEECLQSAVECPAPSSRCAAASLSSSRESKTWSALPRDEAQRSALHERASPGRHAPKFTPNPRLTFVVHLDGMKEIHDYICDYPGLWDVSPWTRSRPRARPASASRRTRRSSRRRRSRTSSR